MKRLLITGSRDWTNSLAVAMAIYDARLRLSVAPESCVLVSGNCPTGADEIAETYARLNGYSVELHPVVWRPYGIYNPHAGHARNSEMVALGADVCLAFIRDGSPGASDCARKAEAAGIPTVRYEA